jgi:hypothetical protein
MFDAFGARRLRWGADITRLVGSYAAWLDHFKQGLEFSSAEDKEWMLGKSAAEALRWPESRAAAGPARPTRQESVPPHPA